MQSGKSSATEGRWSLYRLLADPGRLRILALAAEEELSVGELSELLGDSQPNVSRQSAALRQGGLIVDRREGTRTFVRLAASVKLDAVVRDALAEGQRLCAEEGRLERVPMMVRKRSGAASDAPPWRDDAERDLRVASELPALIFAMAGLSVERATAVDAASGDGSALDLLAPTFTRVIAVEQSDALLKLAAARIAMRGYENIELHRGDIADREVRRLVGVGANVVLACRILHHAQQPDHAMAALAALLAPGGELIVVDYQPHQDERLRTQRADVWLGFSREELLRLAKLAGLVQVRWIEVPKGFVSGAVDGHVPWQVLRATRPNGSG